MLEERVHVEYLGCGVYMYPTQYKLVWIGKRPLDRFVQVSLVQPELAHRPTHTHLGAHELGGGVDAESDAYLAPLSLRDQSQPVDLVQGLHVYRENPLIDGPPELIIGLGGSGEHNVLRGKPRGPRHHQLAR